MTKFVGVGKSTHSDKLWRRSPNYQFAAKEPLTPIIIPEIIRIAAGMPIVFMRQEGRYFLMAMMSPLPKENLFIGPDGQWLGDYVPTGLQSYPFILARREGADQFTLCVDENSGLVVDAAEGGESFFSTDGEPSPAISKVLEFLRQLEGCRTATDLAVSSLAEAGVIEIWPLEAEVDGRKTGIKGLHRVNETALGTLDDEAFVKLRKTGALQLAYTQLMSMAQIIRFARLAQLKRQLAAQKLKIKPEEIFKMEPTDLIRFDN